MNKVAFIKFSQGETLEIWQEKKAQENDTNTIGMHSLRQSFSEDTVTTQSH